MSGSGAVATQSDQLTDSTGNEAPARWGWPILVAVFVIGLALRLTAAALPERLLVRITIDDAFYYLRTAQEVGLGNGSTFDGISPTNGYHPLWLAVLTPIMRIFGTGTGTVRVLIVLQAAIAAATFILAARVLLRWLPPLAVALGGAIWWLTPLSVLSSVTGVESSLACLLVVLLVTAACRYVDAPSRGAAVAVGLVTGLAFLARTDTVFATAAVAVWVVLQVRSRPRRTFATHIGVAAATACAVTLPWLVWNLVTFGTIEQASARARPLVEWHQLTGDTTPQLDEVVTSASRYLSGEWFRDLGWTSIVALAVLVGAVWAWRRVGFPEGPVRRLLLLAGLLVASGTVLAAFHAGVRLVPREYYFEWVRMSVGFLVAAAVAGTGRTRRTIVGTRRHRSEQRSP